MHHAEVSTISKDTGRSSRVRRIRCSGVMMQQAHEMFTHSREAYASALNQHGPVIGVWRKGRVSPSLPSGKMPEMQHNYSSNILSMKNTRTMYSAGTMNSVLRRALQRCVPALMLKQRGKLVLLDLERVVPHVINQRKFFQGHAHDNIRRCNPESG